MKERIQTGIVIFILFFIPFFFGDIWFSSFSFLLALLVLREFCTMANINLLSIEGFLGIIATFLLFLPTAGIFLPVSEVHIFYLLLFLFLIISTMKKNMTIETVGLFLIGIFYSGIGMLSLASFRIEKGLLWTLGVLLIIWITDSGAYFVGRKIGKRKLAPHISPNKTIEGSVGGTVVALVVMLTLQVTFPMFGSLLEAVILTVLVSIFGQLGDLIESSLKRHFNVKDSGNLLPGHGGVFDRLDSCIFVFFGLYMMQPLLFLIF